MLFTAQAQHRTDRRSAAYVPVTFPAGHAPRVNTATPKTETAALARCGELARRAVSAAMLAMPDRKIYSDSDVADVAAEIVARILADAPVSRCHGGCAGPVRYRRTVTDDHGTAVAVHACELHRRSGDRLVIDRADALPADRVAVTRLFGMASNLRRSLDRSRDRDAERAGADAAANRFSPPPDEDTEDPLAGTPEGAHQTTLDVLAAAGVRESSPVLRSDRTAVLRRLKRAQVALLRAVHGDRPVGSPGASVAAYIARVERAVFLLKVAELATLERRPRWTPVAPLRKGHAAVYAATYAAVRTAGADLDRDELADELAMSVENLKKVRQRGTSRLAYGHPHQWAETLGLPDGGTDRPRTAGLSESFGVRVSFNDDGESVAFPNVGERRPDRPAAVVKVGPVHVRRDSRPPVKPWHAIAPERRRTADWTATLPDRSHSRLAAAARITRERRALKDSARVLADTPMMLPGTAPRRTGSWTPPAAPPAAPLRVSMPEPTYRPTGTGSNGTPPLPERCCASTHRAILAAMLKVREEREDRERAVARTGRIASSAAA